MSLFRTPFTDVFGHVGTQQNFGRCRDFEMKFYECVEAYGAPGCKTKCKDEWHDFKECYVRDKQKARERLMAAERHRQYKAGERSSKDYYAPPPPFDSY